MGRIDNTVFLSYRRTNIGYALAIYQNLTAQGYDVFFDYNSIDSGDFEQIILNNIASRAHFVVLLTPSAIERVNEEGDWLRREIEYAIETKRNIVPLTMEGFDWKVVQDKLTGKLAPLGNYNALRVPADYFMEAMDRLAARYLNIAVDAVLHPRNTQAQQAASRAKTQASAEPKVQENVLTALEYFEIAYEQQENDDYDSAIENYTYAIDAKPDFAAAYNNRGCVRFEKGDIDGAYSDVNKAIHLDPQLAQAYLSRGYVLYKQGNYNAAMKDYNEAIRLNSNYPDAYNNRGAVYAIKGDVTKAKADWEKSLEINPNYQAARDNLKLLKDNL